MAISNQTMENFGLTEAWRTALLRQASTYQGLSSAVLVEAKHQQLWYNTGDNRPRSKK